MLWVNGLLVKTPVCDETAHVVNQTLSDGSLTLSKGVVDAEAAQDFFDVAGVEESVSSDHHLERLWVWRREIHVSRFKNVKLI